MKRSVYSMLVSLVAAGLLMAGCAPAAPPAPTKAPEPTKSVQATVAPTKAPAAPTAAPAAPTAAPAAPTAAPAAKVAWPEKGKAITIVVPFAAGGPSDLIIRSLAPPLEKELGVPIQILNKAGASTLLGLTDVARAKPDGYTLGNANQPTSQVAYLDPEAKAAIGRKDLQPIANIESHSSALFTNAEGPFKTTKDLIDAAKAKPESVKFATNGLLSGSALIGYFLQDVAGVKFAFVHFDGGAPAMTAVLGGHADVAALGPSIGMPQVQAGKLIPVATTGKQENKFVPGAKTLQAQGYNVVALVSNSLVAPAGTPKEIVDILTNAVKRAMADGDFKKKMDEQGNEPTYMDPTQLGADFDDAERQARLGLKTVRGQ